MSGGKKKYTTDLKFEIAQKYQKGNVVAILDTNGTKVVGYSYDVWGRLLTRTGSMASTLGLHNPLRYRGNVYD